MRESLIKTLSSYVKLRKLSSDFLPRKSDSTKMAFAFDNSLGSSSSLLDPSESELLHRTFDLLVGRFVRVADSPVSPVAANHTPPLRRSPFHQNHDPRD